MQTLADRVRHRGALEIVIACVALAPPLASAAPLVFEETDRIVSPDPAFQFPRRVAVEGDTIIATGRKLEGDIEHHAAFLFRRQANGDWVYVSTLATTSCNSGEVAEETCESAVAIRDGVAVVAADAVHVFERSADGSWVPAPSDGFTGPGDAAVGTGTVLTSESVACVWATKAFRKNAAGVWSLVATIPGPTFPNCDAWGRKGSAVGMSAGNRLIVGSANFGTHADIYEPSSTTWVHTAALTSPVNGIYFGDVVAIDDSRAFVSGTSETPIHVFDRNTGSWLHTTNIVPPDSVEHGPPWSLEARELLIAGFGSDPHRSGSVRVFQQTSSGGYEQVARLVASDSSSERVFLGGHVDADVDGAFARIAATGLDALYVFDLDRWGTTPPPGQENFELGNAASWTPMAGSAFSVVTSGGSNVYRQSSAGGDAGSFVTGLDWTNQAIEADVKPTAFGGSNGWVGLAVRRTDANNFYYITLRRSNVLELKCMLNGAFVTLASTPVPVDLSRTYRLRLEAVGTLLRAYVDGRLALEAHDVALTHGHPGVRMYRARADIDNVILSQNAQLTLHDQRSYRGLNERWILGPGTWTEILTNDIQGLMQQDSSGDARAVTRVPAGDQIVQVRAAATAFASGEGGRWFGVMARYVDEGNYYYVTVRRDNTVSLRKLVNGAIHVLDSAPLTVSTGTSYALRLEAIGHSLRAYVNGRLLLEATDASHAAGRYGVVTYKAAATFDDFVAWEP